MGQTTKEVQAVLDAVECCMGLKDLHGTHVPWQICRAWEGYKRSEKPPPGRSSKAEPGYPELKPDIPEADGAPCGSCGSWPCRCTVPESPDEKIKHRCPDCLAPEGDPHPPECKIKARDALVEELFNQEGSLNTIWRILEKEGWDTETTTIGRILKRLEDLLAYRRALSGEKGGA